MAGSIKTKLRPIKIAFLVDPKDKAAVLEAIKTSSFLWGGIYHPIIPVIKRIPKTWKKEDIFINKNTPKEITLGYIDAYDPDYFVPINDCNIKHLNLDPKRIISTKQILGSVSATGIPAYGVGISEIINYFIEKELKFVRKNPLNVYFTKFNKGSELFLASIFGKLPDHIDRLIEDNYRERLGAETKKISSENYTEFLKPNGLFIRRFSSLYLDVRSSRWGSDACIYLLDEKNSYDIIDFWNLRAMGWKVIPVSKQSYNSESTKQFILKFIEENFESGEPTKPTYHATILKGRSVDKKEMEEFVKYLDIPAPERPNTAKFVSQYWYPRIWNEWARDKDGVERCELEAGETDYDFSETDVSISPKCIDPKFAAQFGINGLPRYANILDFRTFKGKEILAEVMPAGKGIELVRSIGSFDFDAWRFSNKELVYLVEHTDWKIHLSVPSAKEIFSGWMESMGWKISISNSGNIGYQIIKKLGGVHGLSIFAFEGVLDLLKKMEDGKTISKEEFFKEISKAANSRRYPRDPKGLATWLLKTDMIKLGVELQCPVCQEHSWFSLSDLDYQVQCQKCHEYFQTPMESPNDIKWSYKSFGPFSIPGRAYGVYSVLLALRFFSQLMDRPITPILSFRAEKDNKEIEVDLAMLFKETRYGVSDTDHVFVECKSYKEEFKKKDIDRMSFLAEKFPGSIIVFVSLKKELSNKEKGLIRPFVNKGRKQWKTDKPYNPVLILTATELFSDWGPPECWKDAGDPYKPFADQYKNSWRELIPLCDITQQIYLGMKPWREWLDEKREKRKKLKKVSI